MKKKRIHQCAAALLAVVFAASMLSGCGSGASTVKESYAYDNSSYEAAESFAEEYVGGWEAESASTVSTSANAEKVTENANSTSRKLIRNVSMNVETKEYDTFVPEVKNQILAAGGYIESSNETNYSYNSYNSNRYMNMTVRIPSAKLDDFLSFIGNAGNVTSKSENTEDVTLAYVDIESHRDALRAEEERVLEFMSRAETLEELMTVEERLTNIRYQLESMEAQLRTYDNKVDYSTVRLTIEEVVELTEIEPEEKTVLQKIAEGFTRSLENVGDGLVDFFVGFVIAIPYLVVWAVIIAVIVLIIRAVIKSSKKRSEKAHEAALIAQAKALAKAQAVAKGEITADAAETVTEGEK